MDGELLSTIRSAMGGLQRCGVRDVVGNLECSYSFDSPYSEGGLFVNLTSLQGCGAEFVVGDAAKTGCVLYAHHVWKKSPKAEAGAAAATASEGPTTLGVGVGARRGGFLSFLCVMCLPRLGG